MVDLPIKLGNLMSAVSSPTGLCSDKLFLTLPVTALSRKFSDNQLYIVTRILAMRHAGIVFLREEVALWFRLEPAREGAVSHIVRYRPTSIPDFTSLLWILIYSDKLADFFLPRPNVWAIGPNIWATRSSVEKQNGKKEKWQDTSKI